MVLSLLFIGTKRKRISEEIMRTSIQVLILTLALGLTLPACSEKDDGGGSSKKVRTDKKKPAPVVTVDENGETLDSGNINTEKNLRPTRLSDLSNSSSSRTNDESEYEVIYDSEKETSNTANANTEQGEAIQDDVEYFDDYLYPRHQVEQFFMQLPKRKRNIWLSVSEGHCEEVVNDDQSLRHFRCDRYFTAERASRLTKKYIETRQLDQYDFNEFQEIAFYLLEVREHYNSDHFVFEIFDKNPENFLQDFFGREELLGAVNLAAKFTHDPNDHWDFELFRNIFECLDSHFYQKYGLKNADIKDRKEAAGKAINLMKKVRNGSRVKKKYRMCAGYARR